MPSATERGPRGPSPRPNVPTSPSRASSTYSVSSTAGQRTPGGRSRVSFGVPRGNSRAGPRQASGRKFNGFTSPIVFVISLVLMCLPAVATFFLASESSVSLFVTVLLYDRVRNAIWFLLAFEAYSYIFQCNVTAGRLQTSLFWICLLACFWIRDFPQVPVLCLSLLVPVAAIWTHSIGKNREKNWIWVGHASMVALIFVLAYWVFENVLRTDYNELGPKLSQVDSECPQLDRINVPPKGWEYVRSASECRDSAVDLGIVTKAEALRDVPVDMDNLDGFCVYRNFTTGLLFQTGSFPPPEAEMHYLCSERNLPSIAGEEFTPLRVELVKHIEGVEGDPQCPWGFNLLVYETSPGEIDACSLLSQWSVLYSAAPFMLVMIYFLMACVSYLRGRYLVAAIAKTESSTENIEELNMTAKGVLIGVATLIIAITMGVQMIDAFQQDSLFGQYYLQLCGLIVVVFFFWAIREFSFVAFAGTAVGELSGLGEQLAGLLPGLMKMELVQAGLVFFLWPLYAIVGFSSYLYHAYAKRSMDEDDPRRQQTFAPVFRVLQNYVANNWNLPLVMAWSWLIAVAVILFAVGGTELTKAGLSWLDQTVQLLDMNVVMISFCVFGVFMFMNPAAPGFVVYFFAGIIITKKASTGANAMSYFDGVVLGSAVAIVVKLSACWMQMMIGRLLGRSQQVMYMVGKHTLVFRAVDIILKDPVFTLGKFGVINGGPDWPTSVFCGMIGLPVCKVLLWTVPTIVIVIPAVVSGSTVGNSIPAWQTVNSMTLLLALLFQGCFGFLFARGVAIVTDKHKDELNVRREEDAELFKIDELEAVRSKKLAERATWSKLGPWGRFFIVATFFISVSITYAMMLGRRWCVRTFEMGADYTAPLENGGLNGDFRNILLPPGWICVMIVPLGGICNMCFWICVGMEIYKEPEVVDGSVQLTEKEESP